jgi:DNA-binding transcriptional LysR family regulator
MLDRFESMRVLLKVAELGSFSAAARSLRMSPSMVTKHVAAQEERLGARLLQRTTRRVALTEIGRTYRDMADRIVADLEEAETLTAADQRNVRGLLRVNGPVSFGVRHVAPLMAEFHLAYPSLIVELGLNDRLVDLVDEGWDMAIRVGRLASSALIARKLAPCRMLLCCSPGYLAAHGTPRRVEDLRGHACLGYTLSRAVGVDNWSFGQEGEITVPISGPLRTSNGDALLAAAIAGAGLTYQPTFLLADAVRAGQLIALELDHPPVDMGAIYAIYPPGGRLPAKARVFIDYLAQCFANTPPWDKSLPRARTFPAKPALSD